jgi:hypothetical protein
MQKIRKYNATYESIFERITIGRFPNVRVPGEWPLPISATVA